MLSGGAAWRSVAYGHRGPRGCEATSPVQIRGGSVVRHGDKLTMQQATRWAQRVERHMGSWRWGKVLKKRQSLSQAVTKAEENKLEEIKRHAG